MILLSISFIIFITFPSFSSDKLFLSEYPYKRRYKYNAKNAEKNIYEYDLDRAHPALVKPVFF